MTAVLMAVCMGMPSLAMRPAPEVRRAAERAAQKSIVPAITRTVAEQNKAIRPSAVVKDPGFEEQRLEAQRPATTLRDFETMLERTIQESKEKNLRDLQDKLFATSDDEEGKRLAEQIKKIGGHVGPAIVERAFDKNLVATVNYLLENMEVRGISEEYLFLRAAKEGKVDWVNFFINDRKLCVEFGPHGRNALIAAIDGGHTKVVDALIAANVDVNAQIGKTIKKENVTLYPEDSILAMAAASESENRVQIVESLIAAGARVDGAASSGATPLMFAAAVGNTDVMDVLISKGADINARTENRETVALCTVLGCEADKMEELIVAGIDVDEMTKDGLTALMAAVQVVDADMVDTLIRAHADVNASVGEDTVLHFAAAYGNKRIIDSLVRAGARVDAAYGKGETPLVSAIYNENVETVKALISAHANVNAPDTDGRTPLMHAAYMGNEEIVEALISAHANVNAPDTDGITPLMYAAFHGNVETVKSLIKNGAKVDAARNKKAREEEDWQWLGLGATPLMLAAANGQAGTVEALIEAHANVNATLKENTHDMNRGVTALMVTEDMDVVRLLVEKGHANVKAKDEKGFTVFNYGPEGYDEFVEERDEYLESLKKR